MYIHKGYIYFILAMVFTFHAKVCGSPLKEDHYTFRTVPREHW